MAATHDTKMEWFKWLYDVQYEHLVAGVSGGLTSTLILHPFDLVKIRFAVNDGSLMSAPKYQGIFNAFSTILKQEGFLGLYRGAVPNLWGAGTSWGSYFLFYNSIKINLQGGDINKPLSSTAHFLAATEAGFITVFITNPMWLIKTRMCLQYSDQVQLKSNTNIKYNSMIDAIVKIFKYEGIRGYYKGLGASIAGISHGSIQFMAYDGLKNAHSQYTNRPINTKLTNTEYLTFAAISKLIAVAVTYPYQVVRARLQSQHYSYSGYVECIKKTMKHEGWRGFYKGLLLNLLRVTPANMITFVTYENVSHFLLNYK